MSRTFTNSLLRRWRHAFAVCTFALLLSGCLGGSGSSGFDIAPLAEDAFILQALEEGRCVDAEGLTICPTDTPELMLPDVPGVPGSAPPPVGLETSLGDGSVRCAVDAVTPGQCSVVIELDATGLPEGAASVVAVRSVGPNGDWDLGAATPLGDGGFAAQLLAPADGVQLQVAILVYFQGDAAAPGRVATLSEAGADLAFVSPAVAIVIL